MSRMPVVSAISNRSIAARLRVTERTVKAHVAQVLSQLQVESRLQAGLVTHAYRVMNESQIHSTQHSGWPDPLPWRHLEHALGGVLFPIPSRNSAAISACAAGTHTPWTRR
ncbi:LuxR C-terminal-related transcriptional regulator [Streptomyces murinus]|uniref:LuxR C-terminal-related transcriptional regulator n=1 Tax=Streptomyces murinus TaxID=33900 RepID=UPI000A365C03|nr:LuxR C-terminal-related transcriptional regulator [Streptomyces murinus]